MAELGSEAAPTIHAVFRLTADGEKRCDPRVLHHLDVVFDVLRRRGTENQTLSVDARAGHGGS